MTHPLRLYFLFSLIVAVESVGLYHHCSRIGQMCMNGGMCNAPTGACQCPKDRVGPKCNVWFDDDAIPVCNPPCQNSGVCVTADASRVTSCVCKDDKFYGESCEKKRAMTTCEGNTLHINIVPYPDFAGLVFIKNHNADSDCTFNRTMDGNEAVHTLSVDLASNACSVTEMTDTPSVGYSTYNAEVLIQNSGVFKTILDILVNAKCVYSTSNDAPVSNQLGETTIEDPVEATKAAAESIYEPAKLQVQTAQGLSIDPPVYIGTPLRIYIPLADTGKYTSFTVIQCEVRGQSATPTSVTVIQNGCPNAVGKSIFNGDVEYDPSVPAAIINFNAFRFPDSSDISFACNVKLCNATDVCDRPTCGSGARQKRSAGMNDTGEDYTVEYFFSVLDPSSPTDRTLHELHGSRGMASHVRGQGHKADAVTCIESHGITMIIILLVAAVVILSVVSLAFAVKFLKTRSKS